MIDQEIIDSYDPKELLLLVMKGMEIEIVKDEGKLIYTSNNYIIEVEGKSLYKLMHHDKVIAPYDDLVELCVFIKSDMK